MPGKNSIFKCTHKEFTDSRASSSCFIPCSYKNVHAIVKNMAPPAGASIYKLNIRHWCLKDISFETQMYVHGYLYL